MSDYDEVREGLPPPEKDPSAYTMDKWTELEINAKLSYLRQDAADALRIYVNLTIGRALAETSHLTSAKQVNLAALGYITAQAKYTLACHEAQRGEILPYVELPDA